MAYDETFDSVLAIDPATGQLVKDRTDGVLLTEPGGQVVPIADLLRNPLPALSTSSVGLIGQFRADVTRGWVKFPEGPAVEVLSTRAKDGAAAVLAAQNAEALTRRTAQAVAELVDLRTWGPIARALAAADAGPAMPVLVIGDSIALGWSAPREQSWPSQVFATATARTYQPGQAFSVVPSDPRWATAGAVEWTGVDTGQRAILKPGTSVTFTDSLPSTVVEVSYRQSGFVGSPLSPFTVSIDGGAAVTVTPNGSNAVGRWTSPALTSKAHTVKITGPTAGSSEITAVTMRSSSALGVHLHNAALSGSTSSDWATQTWGAMSSLPLALGTTPTPGVAFVSLGVNDAIAGTDPATYSAQLKTILQRLLMLTPRVGLVIEPMTDRTPDWLTVWAPAQRSVAAELDLPVLDIASRWGAYSSAQAIGLFSGDGLHPSTAGYTDIAAALQGMLAAAATGTGSPSGGGGLTLSQVDARVKLQIDTEADARAAADSALSVALAGKATPADIDSAVSASELAAAQTYARQADLLATARATLTADVAAPSKTMVDTGLSATALPAGSTWLLTWTLIASGDPAADMAVAVTGPAGATVTGVIQGLAAGAGAITGGHKTEPYTTLGAVSAPIGTIGDTVLSAVVVSAQVVIGSTAGTVGLTVAQDVANAVATRVRAGSWMSAARVA